jgi:MOSC domain-containing protein YiiM
MTAVKQMSYRHPLQALLTGKLAPLLPRTELSAIGKRPVSGRVWLGPFGLEGDERGDVARHGGLDKALHHYPREHYPYWETLLNCRPWTLELGAFGENLSTLGLDESNVSVGDTWSLGKAVIQVSQGRQPCWRLNLRFGQPQMARWVQQSGRTGWYYRVVEPGFVAPDDELQLLFRPYPGWTIRRLLRVLYEERLSYGDLEAIAGLRELAPSWRALARSRLETRSVEDFELRLTTPTRR